MSSYIRFVKNSRCIRRNNRKIFNANERCRIDKNRVTLGLKNDNIFEMKIHRLMKR